MPSRLTFVALALALVALAVAKAAYATNWWFFYIPATSGSTPFGSPPPITIPSGYQLIAEGNFIVYFFTEPTSNVTVGTAYYTSAAAAGSTVLTSPYIIYFSTGYVYNNYLFGGVMGGTWSSSTSSQYWFGYYNFTVSTESTYTSSISITTSSSSTVTYCWGDVLNSTWGYVNYGSGSGNWTFTIFNTVITAGVQYYVVFACYSTSPVYISVATPSSASVETKEPTIASGDHVLLYWTGTSQVFNIQPTSGYWLLLQAVYPDSTSVTLLNASSTVVYRSYTMYDTALGAESNGWVVSPSWSSTINMLALSGTTLQSATVNNIKLGVGALQFTSNSAGNAGEYFQLPQCVINSNPYGGKTGTYNLLSCIAISYGGVTAVVKFYEPPGGKGVILNYGYQPYPNYEQYYVPQVYIGTNGYLYVGDWNGQSYNGLNWQLTTPISPGWHTLVYSIYYSSGTFYLQAWLDGNYLGELTSTKLLFLFGAASNSPYGYIGTGYTNSWANTNGGWFFFNGSIALIALYPGPPTQAEINVASGGPLPPGYIALYTAGSYVSSTDVWYDASGQGNNAAGGYSSGFSAPTVTGNIVISSASSLTIYYTPEPKAGVSFQLLPPGWSSMTFIVEPTSGLNYVNYTANYATGTSSTSNVVIAYNDPQLVPLPALSIKNLQLPGSAYTYVLENSTNYLPNLWATVGFGTFYYLAGSYNNIYFNDTLSPWMSTEPSLTATVVKFYAENPVNESVTLASPSQIYISAIPASFAVPGGSAPQVGYFAQQFNGMTVWYVKYLATFDISVSSSSVTIAYPTNAKAYLGIVPNSNYNPGTVYVTSNQTYTLVYTGPFPAIINQLLPNMGWFNRIEVIFKTPSTSPSTPQGIIGVDSMSFNGLNPLTVNPTGWRPLVWQSGSTLYAYYVAQTLNNPNSCPFASVAIATVNPGDLENVTVIWSYPMYEILINGTVVLKEPVALYSCSAQAPGNELTLGFATLSSFAANPPYQTYSGTIYMVKVGFLKGVAQVGYFYNITGLATASVLVGFTASQYQPTSNAPYGSPGGTTYALYVPSWPPASYNTIYTVYTPTWAQLNLPWNYAANTILSVNGFPVAFNAPNLNQIGIIYAPSSASAWPGLSLNPRVVPVSTGYTMPSAVYIGPAPPYAYVGVSVMYVNASGGYQAYAANAYLATSSTPPYYSGFDSVYSIAMLANGTAYKFRLLSSSSYTAVNGFIIGYALPYTLINMTLALMNGLSANLDYAYAQFSINSTGQYSAFAPTPNWGYVGPVALPYPPSSVDIGPGGYVSPLYAYEPCSDVAYPSMTSTTVTVYQSGQVVNQLVFNGIRGIMLGTAPHYTDYLAYYLNNDLIILPPIYRMASASGVNVIDSYWPTTTLNVYVATTQEAAQYWSTGPVYGGISYSVAYGPTVYVNGFAFSGLSYQQYSVASVTIPSCTIGSYVSLTFLDIPTRANMTISQPLYNPVYVLLSLAPTLNIPSLQFVPIGQGSYVYAYYLNSTTLVLLASGVKEFIYKWVNATGAVLATGTISAFPAELAIPANAAYLILNSSTGEIAWAVNFYPNIPVDTNLVSYIISSLFGTGVSSLAYTVFIMFPLTLSVFFIRRRWLVIAPLLYLAVLYMLHAAAWNVLLPSTAAIAFVVILMLLVKRPSSA